MTENIYIFKISFEERHMKTFQTTFIMERVRDYRNKNMKNRNTTNRNLSYETYSEDNIFIVSVFDKEYVKYLCDYFRIKYEESEIKYSVYW